MKPLRIESFIKHPVCQSVNGRNATRDTDEIYAGIVCDNWFATRVLSPLDPFAENQQLWRCSI